LLDHEQLVKLQGITQDLLPRFEPHGRSPEDSWNVKPMVAPEMAQSLTGSSTLTANWVKQWEDVLTRYADEVWGVLLPLVKEARKEIEELRSDEDSKEVPDAVRRLQSILGHFQKDKPNAAQ